MFYLKNKVFQHVAEMLKLQTFHSNWTARACNFSKEIRSSLVSTKKKIIDLAPLLITLRTIFMVFQLKWSARVDYNEGFLLCTSSNMTLQFIENRFQIPPYLSYDTYLANSFIFTPGLFSRDDKLFGIQDMGKGYVHKRPNSKISPLKAAISEQKEQRLHFDL